MVPAKAVVAMYALMGAVLAVLAHFMLKGDTVFSALWAVVAFLYVLVTWAISAA